MTTTENGHPADYDDIPPEYDEVAPEDFEEVEITDTAGEAGEAEVEASELTDALTEAVRKAVATQVATAAQQVADGVIGPVLTPAVVRGMRETAVNEAAAAVDPDRVVEEPPEEKPELRFKTLTEFVEKYVAHTYRREVTARGAEDKTRWCPEWWKHGEAIARLRHLWTAFEEMRRVPGQEMSSFWLHHFDEHMDRLFDLRGPFMYCSPVGGHKDKLPALPTVRPPEGMFVEDDGNEPDEQPAVELTSSRLILPAHKPTGNRRVVIPEATFP